MSSPSSQPHLPTDVPPSAAPQSSLPTQASTFQPFFTLISPTTANPSHSHPHVHYVFADDPTDPTLDLPPSNRERIITVDIDSSLHVTSAHSLSKDFQLVNATVSSAPQMLAASEGEAAVAGGGGLMLTIEGVEGGLRGVKASGGVYELAEAFSDRSEPPPPTPFLRSLLLLSFSTGI
jgi:hypothetical protein